MRQNSLKSNSADILILTDAGKKIGRGHVTRCSAIASAIEQQGVQVVFAIHCDAVIEDLVLFDYILCDWHNGLQSLDLSRYKLVLVDSYQADSAIIDVVCTQAAKVAFYDDGCNLDLPKGYVFNGLPYAHNLCYTNKESKYFLGTKYLPVRPEFLSLSRNKVQDTIENIFICVGSSDLTNVIPYCITAIYKILKSPVITVVGHMSQPVSNVANYYSSLSASEIMGLMATSDIAIGNGGQVSTELAKLGIPSLLYCVAQNQYMNTSYLIENKIVLDGGSYTNTPHELTCIIEKS